MSMEGHPVTIITLDEDEKLNLDLVALGSVLNQPELKDRPVCLLPIAGTFCLLTICLNQRHEVFSSHLDTNPSHLMYT